MKNMNDYKQSIFKNFSTMLTDAKLKISTYFE